MKKALILLGVAALILAFVMPDAFVWSSKIFLSKPTTHNIQKGEYLSKISLKYYGTAKYWRELALINRAPDSDLVFPDEEIFIPSQEVIEQLHRARSLSRVNNLMGDKKQIYAQGYISPDVDMVAQESDSIISSAVASGAVEGSESAIAENELSTTESNAEAKKIPALLPILGVIGLLGLIAVVGFIVYKKRKQSEEKHLLEELKDVNLDTETESDDEEPDYTEYKRNRSKRVYV